MAVSLSSIADYLASLGLDAAKAFFKEKIDEAKLRSALTEYIEQQRQCHDFCTLAEEFDYQGLVDYIRRELLSDVEKRFFDTNSHNRASAQQSIIDKAIIYANAETPEAKREVAKLVAVSLELIRGFYKKDFSKKDYLLAAEIVDAVRDDTTRIVQDAITGIKGKLSGIETVVLDNKKVISMDNAVESFENNGFAQIEAEHRKLFDYFSLQHILYPYYGYRMENGKVCSIPLRADSLEFAPPKLSITGAVRVPDNVSALFGKDPCSYAYRHQQTLMIDVSGAKKYLGDVMDPVQSEAEAWIGKRIVATPPKLSPVVPCAIYVGEQVFFDYILFRIEEILDDDTFIISNKEQQNKPISFAVYMKLNADKADFQFNIRENATNRDVLNFALFIKALDKREAMIIRRLDTRETFMSGIMSGGDYKIRFDSIDDEIDYLKRICAIEEYFAVSISPWGDISIDEYRAVVRLSDMIIHGHMEYRWNKSTLTGSFTEKFREAINEQDDKQFLLQMHATEDFSFHGTTVEVRFLRTYQSAVLEDMERIKKLAELLRPGESINLTFVPGENDIVVEELETVNAMA